jgi:hypothetical protein
VFAEIAEVSMRQLGVIPETSVVGAALLRARSVAAERESAERRAGIVDEPVPLEPKTPPPGTMPSFIGLTARQVMARYVELGLGLDIEVHGSGRVVQQQPAPGSTDVSEGRVLLTLATSTR